MKIIPVQITILSQHKKLLLTIGRFAKRRNIQIWAVGGCVRDWYLGRKTKDIDLITESDGKPIADFIFRKYKAEKTAFDKFGTFRLNFPNGLTIDLAQTRKEIYPEPACLPKVTFAKIKEDLYRRDFTVNTAAISIMAKNFGQIYDPFGALADIDKAVIKILHKKSFTDDPTRLFRALRFAGRFNWKLDEETSKLAKKAVKQKLPDLVSRSRMARELMCILSEKNPVPVFKLLEQYRLLEFFYPQFKWNKKPFVLKNPHERLGVLACLMGSRGGDFLKSLNLKREIFMELKTAVELHTAKTAHSKPLTCTQKNILKTANTNLPAIALKPLVIAGKDLQKLNIKPQKKYSRILNKIARLQWQGKTKTKKQAVEFVKSNY